MTKWRRWVAAAGVVGVALLGVGQDYVLPNPKWGWGVPAEAPRGRLPAASVRIAIAGGGTWVVDPREVRTVRADVFREGHVSVFDLLVHLSREGKLSLVYRYDEDLATHVIETLNGQAGWWYEAHYAGGGFEPNAVRMDHYPVKDGLAVRLYREDPGRLATLYAGFRREAERRAAHGGRVVVPEVTIRGPGWTLAFRNVEVHPHGVRSDLFQPEVVTALDVLLALGEQGALSGLELTWYARIGRADPVDAYYVTFIAGGGHSAKAYDRCGFVYELGEVLFRSIRGTLVHITADARVLVSPEFIVWSWRCL